MPQDLLGIPQDLFIKYCLTINCFRKSLDAIKQFGEASPFMLIVIENFKNLDIKRQELHDEILKSTGKTREDFIFAEKLDKLLSFYINY